MRFYPDENVSEVKMKMEIIVNILNMPCKKNGSQN